MQYPVRTGPLQNDASPFSPEMVQGVTVNRPRLPFRTQHLSNIQPLDISTFLQEFIGSHPDSPRIKLGVRIGQPIFPLAPDASEENSAVIFIPGRSRVRHKPQQSQPILVWVDVTTTVEAFKGYQPERPRILLGPRIGLPISQTTHTAAPISVEMFTGYHPDTSRAFVAPKQGYFTNDQPTTATVVVSLSDKQFIGEIQQLGIGAILDASMGVN